jgi:hypothetical protein
MVLWVSGYRPKKLLADGAIHIIQSIGFNNSFITVQWQRYESTNYRTSNEIKTKSYLHNL